MDRRRVANKARPRPRRNQEREQEPATAHVRVLVGDHGLRTGDGVRADKVWFYDAPHAAVSRIAGHVAFYPDAVEFSLT